jgi:hypothetical protein
MSRRILFIISFAVALLCQLFLWPALDGVHGGTVPSSQNTYLPTVRTSCFDAKSIFQCNPSVFSVRPGDVISPVQSVSHTGFDTYINPVTGVRTTVRYSYIVITGTVVYDQQAFVFDGTITETHAAYIEFLGGAERRDIPFDPQFADEFSVAVTSHGDVTETAVLFRVENTLTSLVARGTGAPCDAQCMAYTIRRRIK